MNLFDSGLEYSQKVILGQIWEIRFQIAYLARHTERPMFESEYKDIQVIIEARKIELQEIEAANPDLVEYKSGEPILQFDPRLNMQQRQTIFELRRLVFRNEIIDQLINSASDEFLPALEQEKTKNEKEIAKIESECTHPVCDVSGGGGKFCSICDCYLGIQH